SSPPVRVGRMKLGSTGRRTQRRHRGNAMRAARELANFLTGVTPSDLPTQAMDHAAVLIASTLASAAMGSTLESSRIVKDMAVSLGGSARASIWFDKA